jgi:hypothetical protein
VGFPSEWASELYVVGYGCSALSGSDATIGTFLLERGAWGHKNKLLTATGVNDAVLAACLRNGEEQGGLLDCIFRVLSAVRDGACSVVVFCKSGKRRSAGAGAMAVS